MALSIVVFNLTFVSFLTRLPKCAKVSESGEVMSLGVIFDGAHMPFRICFDVKL